MPHENADGLWAAVCVIDNLAGINTPRKLGPMLRLADVVAVTKGDIHRCRSAAHRHSNRHIGNHYGEACLKHALCQYSAAFFHLPSPVRFVCVSLCYHFQSLY